MMLVKVFGAVTDKIETKNIPRGSFELKDILNVAYAVMGMVAVVAIVYNAIQYLFSQGDPGKTKRATQGIIFAAIGLGIVLMAAVITNFVFTTVGQAS